MLEKEIEQAFKSSVCDEVELSKVGINRYLVHVPFTFEDGDHYAVILKQGDNGRWILSDEGHTFMHVSYDVPEFERGNRRAIIDKVLAGQGIEDRVGELILPISEMQFGDALFSYLQAITRITDVSFLSRERIRTTFAEDFQTVVREASGNHEVQFGYWHPVHDQERRYAVDAWLDGGLERQVLVFGISNDDQCRDATITLYRWEGWQEKFHVISIFRDQTEVNRVVLARFSDVAERQFSSLDTAKERLRPYLADIMR